MWYARPHANSYHDFDPSVNAARADELRARLADEKIPLTLAWDATSTCRSTT